MDVDVGKAMHAIPPFKQPLLLDCRYSKDGANEPKDTIIRTYVNETLPQGDAESHTNAYLDNHGRRIFIESACCVQIAERRFKVETCGSQPRDACASYVRIQIQRGAFVPIARCSSQFAVDDYSEAVMAFTAPSQVDSQEIGPPLPFAVSAYVRKNAEFAG